MPALLLWAIAATAGGCGSSSSSTSPGRATTTTSGAVNPNAKETLPPGDIPDAIAYVPYAVPGAGVSVSVPEGWSRTNAANTVAFSDKLNTIRVAISAAHGPMSVASAQSAEVPKLKAAVMGFQLQSVSSVSRRAGPAVRVAYLGDSPPDPVTGKVGVLAFERYDFAHGGKAVALTLSAPNGSDNVDPWRKVTNSLRFSR